MSDSMSLPDIKDLDTTMRKVARTLSMGLYELEHILSNFAIDRREFDRWKGHPRFISYLKTEQEAWNAATNTAERTKMKAAIVMEEFMQEAHAGLHDRKTPLNQRVELGKLVAKIAGMGEPRVLNTGVAGSGGFHLQINIGPGVSERISIRPEMGKLINYEDGATEDAYDPFSSPNTLEDFS